MNKTEILSAIQAADNYGQLVTLAGQTGGDEELLTAIIARKGELMDDDYELECMPPESLVKRIDEAVALAASGASEVCIASNEGAAPSPEGEVVGEVEELAYVPSDRKVREVAAAVAPKEPARTLEEVQELRKSLLDQIKASTDADALTNMLVPELDLATRGDDVKSLRSAVKAATQAKLKELNEGAKPTSAEMRDMFPDVAKKAQFKRTHVAMTHYAVAQRVAAETAGDLRYNIDGQDWLCWDGCRWTTLRAAQVQGIARQTINGMKADAAKLPDVDLEKLEHADSDSFRRGVVGEMMATETVHVEQDDLDQHARYLACGNGSVDLETGKLVCERDLLVTMKNDTEFDPDAKAPLCWRRPKSEPLLRVVPTEN